MFSKGLIVLHEELKAKFDQNLKNDLDILKKQVSTAESRLVIFSSTLLFIVLAVLYAVNSYDLHVIFFMMTLFILGLTFFLGYKGFRFEYQDVIERKIFPKIINSLDSNASFEKYSNIKNNAKESGFFLMYEAYIESRDIAYKYSIVTELETKVVRLSSVYIAMSNIVSPAFSAASQGGILIVIEDINFKDEVYIFRKSFFPSLQQLFRSSKKDYYSFNSDDDKHKIVLQKNLTVNKEKIISISEYIDYDMSLSIVNNKAYIFFEKDFTYFNQEDFVDGKIPEFSDYIGFIELEIKIKKLIKEIKDINLKHYP